MRFPIAAVGFIAASFVFFIMFAACTLIMTEINDAVEPLDDDLGATYEDEMNLIPTAFLIIGCIFFVSGILIIFIMESVSDEPEYYYRRR